MKTRTAPGMGAAMRLAKKGTEPSVLVRFRKTSE